LWEKLKIDFIKGKKSKNDWFFVTEIRGMVLFGIACKWIFDWTGDTAWIRNQT
jgi:hypothetical protein